MARIEAGPVDHTPTLYDVLGLNTKTATAEQIKTAYRKALLQHHPDKNAALGQTKRSFTVDEVTYARQILLDDKLRREYDQGLLRQSGASHDQHLPLNPTELETVDLDDMNFSDNSGRWYRPCRCGNTLAYEFSESDLEEEIQAKSESGSRTGEILVGCGDCSLYIRVVFEALEDEQPEPS